MSRSYSIDEKDITRYLGYLTIWIPLSVPFVPTFNLLQSQKRVF